MGLAVGWLLLEDTGDLRGASGLWIAAVGYLVVGAIEDLRRDQPIMLRLFLQAAVAGVASLALLRGVELSAMTMWIAWLGVAGLLLGFVNVFNFMDGVNGISSIQTIAVASSFAACAAIADEDGLARVCLVLAASAAAFLPFNVSGRVFLGDSGSYLLGGALAALVVVSVRKEIAILAVAPALVPYCADAGATLLRRVLRGDRWWEPHREHAYQRLVDAGWSHVQTALVVGAVSTACGAAGAIAQQGEGGWWALPIVVTPIATIGYLLLPRIAGRPLTRA